MISGIEYGHSAAFYMLKNTKFKMQTGSARMRVQFQGRIHSLNSVPYSFYGTGAKAVVPICISSFKPGTVPFEKVQKLTKNARIVKKFYQNRPRIFLSKLLNETRKRVGILGSRPVKNASKNANTDKKTDPDMGLDPPIKKNATQMGPDPDS